MEVFSVMKQTVTEGKIGLAKKCKLLGLSHLLYADDLLIVVKAKEDFLRLSGLAPNQDKSSLFIGGVPSSATYSLAALIWFPLDRLPIRYLGVFFTCRKIVCHSLQTSVGVC
ncbi:hypothetical protein NE237_002159 [Protea cynaroides]|uniref:Reverse transcriptase domain-containing protein n=1 Tax=Protea cynaroides TaxID=273540 RepID=A0A9Q0QYT5_9MAGN|nr:hypothetical protein NE237_002159 [Protea cynaroides]